MTICDSGLLFWATIYILKWLVATDTCSNGVQDDAGELSLPRRHVRDQESVSIVYHCDHLFFLLFRYCFCCVLIQYVVNKDFRWVSNRLFFQIVLTIDLHGVSRKISLSKNRNLSTPLQDFYVKISDLHVGRSCCDSGFFRDIYFCFLQSCGYLKTF